MKKGILLFSLVAMIFAVSATFAETGAPEKSLAPVKWLPFLDSPGPLAVEPTLSSSKGSERNPSFVDRYGQQHHMVFDPMGNSVIDTLKWHVGGPYDYNDFTGSYDTNFVFFYPLAECSLLEVWGNFHDKATRGSQKISIAGLCYEERGDACVDTCCPFWIDVSEDESDTFRISLTDNLLPSALSWNVAGGDKWSKMDFTLYPENYVLALPPDTAFFVILRACNIDGSPRINWDDCDNFTRQCHHWYFTYVHATYPSRWCPGVNCPSHWYGRWWWCYPELLVMAVVKYTSPPPIVSELGQLMDTYQTNLNLRVYTELREFDGFIQRAELYWKVRNFESIDSTGMELHSPQTTYYTAWGNITGSYSPGDTIDYWCHFWDNDDQGERWMRGEESMKSFVIRELNPKADILLVNDQGGNRGEFYKQILDNLGYQYSYWSISESNGLDRSIVETGNWNTALIFGQEANTLPGKDYGTDSLWVPFLGGGSDTLPRCILYIDQDYFCAHRDDYGCYFDSSLGPGEFMFDYFGVGSATSNVYPRPDLFKFIDPATAGPFLNQTFQIYPESISVSGYADYISPHSNGIGLFSVSDQDTCGVRYDGRKFKTVFLPFILEAAIDPVTKEPIPQADTLIHNILRWFGTRDSLSAIKGSASISSIPQKFNLDQNYPNPFNSTTLIRYALPAVNGQRSAVSLEIYNILGEKVATLVNGKQTPGYKAVTWNAQDVASGIYLCRLQAGRRVMVKKMILLK